MQNLPVSIRSLFNFTIIAALAASIVACGGDNLPATLATSTDTVSLLTSTSKVKATPVYKVTDLGPSSGTGSSAVAINKGGDVAGYSYNPERATLWKEGGTPINLGTLGGNRSYAYGINNAGQVAGISFFSGDAIYHATIWNGTTITDLGTLGGSSSQAFGINKAGQVVGYSFPASDDRQHATIWNGTTPTDLGTLGGRDSIARAINNAGQVVGYSQLVGDAAHDHATLWNGTKAIDLEH